MHTASGSWYPQNVGGGEYCTVVCKYWTHAQRASGLDLTESCIRPRLFSFPNFVASNNFPAFIHLRICHQWTSDSHGSPMNSDLACILCHGTSHGDKVDRTCTSSACITSQQIRFQMLWTLVKTCIAFICSRGLQGFFTTGRTNECWNPTLETGTLFLLWGWRDTGWKDTVSRPLYRTVHVTAFSKRWSKDLGVLFEKHLIDT